MPVVSHPEARVPRVPVRLGRVLQDYRHGLVALPLLVREIEAFASSCVQAERERCAQLCDEQKDFILSAQGGNSLAAQDRELRLIATLGAEACADVIRKT